MLSSAFNTFWFWEMNLFFMYLWLVQVCIYLVQASSLQLTDIIPMLSHLFLSNVNKFKYPKVACHYLILFWTFHYYLYSCLPWNTFVLLFFIIFKVCINVLINAQSKVFHFGIFLYVSLYIVLICPLPHCPSLCLCLPGLVLCHPLKVIPILLSCLSFPPSLKILSFLLTIPFLAWCSAHILECICTGIYTYI